MIGVGIGWVGAGMWIGVECAKAIDCAGIEHTNGTAVDL